MPWQTSHSVKNFSRNKLNGLSCVSHILHCILSPQLTHSGELTGKYKNIEKINYHWWSHSALHRFWPGAGRFKIDKVDNQVWVSWFPERAFLDTGRNIDNEKRLWVDRRIGKTHSAWHHAANKQSKLPWLSWLRFQKRPGSQLRDEETWSYQSWEISHECSTPRQIKFCRLS